MYYTDLLKLCGWEESEIEQEKARLDEAFSILGVGPGEVNHAESWIKENYDLELLGIRKGLGVWIRTAVDLVLGRKEGKKIIYYAFPSIGGLGFITSMLGGEDTLCVCPEFALEVVLGGIFDKIEPIFETAEELALPPGRAQCGLNKIRIGALAKGIIPKPDVMLASSFYCDQGPKTDEWVKEVYNIPWVITDNVLDSAWDQFPEIEPERISYLGTELNQTFDQLLEVIGKKLTEEDWAIYNEQYSRFVALLQKINDLMRADPIPIGQGSLQIIRLCKSAINHRQFPRILEAMETLIPELEQRVAEGKGPVPKGAPRIYSCLFPFRDTSLIRLIENSGVAVPITFMTYDAPLAEFKSSYPTLGERRAEIELKRGMYHSTPGFIYWIEKACRDWNVDGLLWGWPVHCRPFVLTGFTARKEMERRLGIPVLSLEFDFFDSRTFNTEALRTRVETFAQLLSARKVRG